MISADFRHVWKQLVSLCGVEDPTPPGAELAEKIRLRRAATWQFFNETLKDRAEVIEALDRMNLAWGDVRTREQARDLPTVGHRGSIAEVDDRAGGTRPVPQTPYRMSGAETGIRGGAPFLGEHNREVLTQWLGMSDEDVDGYAAVLRADPLPDGADR
jgi:crotonobetainyl-CoA:carnitine CoA-transferase CaiB-like acyl-CoA transferase